MHVEKPSLHIITDVPTSFLNLHISEDQRRNEAELFSSSVFSQFSYLGSGNIWPTRMLLCDRSAGKAGSGRVGPWRKFMQGSASGSRCRSVWPHTAVLSLNQSVTESLLTAVSLSVSRSNGLQEPSVKGRFISPAIKLNRFTNHTTNYTIKNPTGEIFTYTPSGKVRTTSWAAWKIKRTKKCSIILPAFFVP